MYLSRWVAPPHTELRLRTIPTNSGSQSVVFAQKRNARSNGYARVLMSFLLI